MGVTLGYSLHVNVNSSQCGMMWCMYMVRSGWPFPGFPMYSTRAACMHGCIEPVLVCTTSLPIVPFYPILSCPFYFQNGQTSLGNSHNDPDENIPLNCGHPYNQDTFLIPKDVCIMEFSLYSSYAHTCGISDIENQLYVLYVTW